MEQAAERRYLRSATAASFVIAVVAAVFASAAFRFSPRGEDGLFLAVNLALLLGIAYVPPLLQGSPAFVVRSLTWQVKARWMLLLAAILYWFVAVRPDGGQRFFAAATVLAAVSLAAFAVGRRHWHAHEIAWTMLFAGDLAVLVYASNALEASLTLAVLATVSAFLLIVSSGKGPRAALAFVAGIYIGLLFGAMGWLRGYAIAWFMVVALSAWWLTRIAAQPTHAVAPSVSPSPPLMPPAPVKESDAAGDPETPPPGNSSATPQS